MTPRRPRSPAGILEERIRLWGRFLAELPALVKEHGEKYSWERAVNQAVWDTQDGNSLTDKMLALGELP